MLHVKHFVISFLIYCCFILGAWLAGAPVTIWAFILGFVFCILLVAVVAIIEKSKL